MGKENFGIILNPSAVQAGNKQGRDDNMAYITKGEEKFYYYRLGKSDSDTTVFFIHGAVMTGEGMRPVAQAFTEYNCIAVDLPGHGNSVGESKLTVQEFADCIEFMIKEMLDEKIITENIILAGYSMGGAISVELALRNIPQIKKIIILSSGANFKNNLPLIEKSTQMPVEEFNSAELFSHGFGRRSTAEQTETLLAALLETKAEDSVGYTDLKYACTYERIEETSNIKIPVLIISGDDDEIVPVNVPISLKEHVPQSVLTIMPYRGHFGIFEETEYVCGIMKDFIKS